ncbi:MAG: glycosyltransferase, partial [Chryseobacterium sp.]
GKGRIDIYIKNETNLKLIKSLNKGVDLATGKYIARMDADDISLPERFEKQIEVFNAYKEIDIVNISPFLLEEDGKNYREIKPHMTLSFEAIKFLIPFQNFICHPGVMIKSDILKKYKFKDDISAEHIEDFELWNRILRDGHICYTIEKCLLLWRNNPANITNTQNEKQIGRMYSSSSEILKNDFNFKIKESSFRALLGEKVNVNYTSLKDIDNALTEYFSIIKNNHPISSLACDEMELWRKRKLMFLALKSLSVNKPVRSLGIAFFLFYFSPAILNRGVRKFLFKTTNTRELKTN